MVHWLTLGGGGVRQMPSDQGRGDRVKGTMGVFADFGFTGFLLVSAEGVGAAVLRASVMDDWVADTWYTVISFGAIEFLLELRITGGELEARIDSR